MLPPFKIRNLRLPDQLLSNSDLLVRISAPGYDRTLSDHPAATLRYYDEDDGDLITVGSSTELITRLEEPVSSIREADSRLSQDRILTTRFSSEFQQYSEISDYHIFQIDDREDVQMVWKEIQRKSLEHAEGAGPPAVTTNEHASNDDVVLGKSRGAYLGENENNGEIRYHTSNSISSPHEAYPFSNAWDEEEQKNDFARVYRSLRPDIWSPLAKKLDVNWRVVEAIHWALGKHELADRANTYPQKARTFDLAPLPTFEDLTLDPKALKTKKARNASLEEYFEDPRLHHFNISQPPRTDHAPNPIEAYESKALFEPSLGNGKDFLATGPLLSKRPSDSANLTLEGKRQAQAAGDRLRARTASSRHRKVVTIKSQYAEPQNRWADYKSINSGFHPTSSALMSRGLDGPHLTSNGKEEAQSTGDKPRIRTHTIRHCRPSQGPRLMEEGFSRKHPLSKAKLQVARLDESNGSAVDLTEGSNSASTDNEQHGGRPSLLEIFERELAKNLGGENGGEQISEKTGGAGVTPIAAIGSLEENSENIHTSLQDEPLPLQADALVESLKSINEHFQGLLLGNILPAQSLPHPAQDEIRSAIGGFGNFIRGITRKLQEASNLAQRAADRTREIDLRIIDEAIYDLQKMDSISMISNRNGSPIQANSNETRLAAQPKPLIVSAETSPDKMDDNWVPKASSQGVNGSNTLSQASSATYGGRPPTAGINLAQGSENKNDNHQGEFHTTEASKQTSCSVPEHRLSGFNQPRSHESGSVYLPAQYSSKWTLPSTSNPTSSITSGYVENLRRSQTAEVSNEPENSNVAISSSVDTRFPTLEQFEGQNFTLSPIFSALPNIEPTSILSEQNIFSPGPQMEDTISKDQYQLLSNDSTIGKFVEPQAAMVKEQYLAGQILPIQADAHHLMNAQLPDRLSKASFNSTTDPLRLSHDTTVTLPKQLARDGLPRVSISSQQTPLPEENPEPLASFKRAARLAEPFDPSEAEPTAQPHFNAAVAPKLETLPSLTAKESMERKEKWIRYCRYKLQKGLLPRENAPREDMMNSMSEFLAALEQYPSLESSIIRTTKIHKVLKAVIKLPAIPRDEEYHIKSRCSELLRKWNQKPVNDIIGLGAEAATKAEVSAAAAPAVNAACHVTASDSKTQASAVEAAVVNLAAREPNAEVSKPLRRHATVAGSSSRYNQQYRRPYSLAFDGTGRVSWDSFLQDRRVDAQAADGNNLFTTPGSISASQGNMTKNVSLSETTLGFASHSEDSPAGKVNECVDQLKKLGFGNDYEQSTSRLSVYAQATNGNLLEAIDMIDEEEQAYKEIVSSESIS